MREIDRTVLRGEFAVYREALYLESAYQDDVWLYQICDMDKKELICKVARSELNDRFTLYTRVYLNGVEYIARELRDSEIIYERAVCDKELHTVSISDCDAIVRYRNHEDKRKEIEFFYRNPVRFHLNDTDKRFFPEEMHNGHLMLSYGDDEIDIRETGQILTALYGKRLHRYQNFNPSTLIFDYYVEQIKIDDIGFTLTLDWEIVTLSPEGEGGDYYIREICKYLNERYYS